MKRTPELLWHDMFALNAYWFGVSFMWNAIHPIVLPTLLLPFVADGAKNTAVGMVTLIGLLVAMLTTPVSGSISDNTRHKLGRRRPWLLVGVAFDLVFLTVLILARSFWAIAAGYVLLQFSSNVAHGPGQGLIPDLVPHHRRGEACGIKNLMDMCGVIAAALLVGRLVDTDGLGVLPALLVVVLLLLAGLLVTVRGINEPCTQNGERPVRRRAHLTNLLRAVPRLSLRIDLRGHSAYAILMAARFAVLLGTFAVQSFALYYVRDVLQSPSPAKVVGQLMAVIGISIVVVVYPAGLLCERWGRKRLSLFACGVIALGMALLLVTHTITALLIIGCVIGMGMGVFSTVNWAWATDLVPVTEAGKYLGFSNFATAGSAAAARLLGPAIDLLNLHRANAGYSLLFIVASIGALAGLLLIWHISEPGQHCTALREVAVSLGCESKRALPSRLEHIT